MLSSMCAVFVCVVLLNHVICAVHICFRTHNEPCTANIYTIIQQTGKQHTIQQKLSRQQKTAYIY